jgi:hypothetical protein
MRGAACPLREWADIAVLGLVDPDASGPVCTKVEDDLRTVLIAEGGRFAGGTETGRVLPSSPTRHDLLESVRLMAA